MRLVSFVLLLQLKRLPWRSSTKCVELETTATSLATLQEYTPLSFVETLKRVTCGIRNDTWLPRWIRTPLRNHSIWCGSGLPSTSQVRTRSTPASGLAVGSLNFTTASPNPTGKIRQKYLVNNATLDLDIERYGGVSVRFFMIDACT